MGTRCVLIVRLSLWSDGLTRVSVLQCVAVCCSVLQCVAACCSVLQCVAVCCSVLQFVCPCNLIVRQECLYLKVARHMDSFIYAVSPCEGT